MSGVHDLCSMNREAVAATHAPLSIKLLCSVFVPRQYPTIQSLTVMAMGMNVTMMY